MLKKMNDFTFKHTEQPDDLYTYLTSAQVKEKFDSQGIEIKTFLDNLIELLNTDGAKNIGISTIQDVQGNTLQDVLTNLRDILKSTQDGTSGADFINATSIDGLTGNTIQSLLESLKQIIDNHRISNEHDNRYFTKIDLQSIEKDNSGADKIKATPIAAGSGKTVQEQLAWLLSQIAIASTGSIPDGSLGEEKLKVELLNKINKALSNTGVLTTLITDDKSSTVNAINEVKKNVTDFQTSVNVQLNDNVKQLETKATKDGTLQTNLNSEKINSKTAINSPLTSEKVDLIGMVNEVFTSANNSQIQLDKNKINLRNAIVGVDSKLNIPTNPSFSELENAIKSISTGVKYAIIRNATINYHTRIDGNYDSTGWQNKGFFVRGLNFQPRFGVITKTPQGAIACGNDKNLVVNDNFPFDSYTGACLIGMDGYVNQQIGDVILFGGV